MSNRRHPKKPTTTITWADPVAEWREQQRLERAGHHGLNAYKCDTCALIFLTIDVDPGVTPMFLACRRTPGCQGTAFSQGYPDAEPPADYVTRYLMFSWRLPTAREYRTADPAMRDHLDRGGLLLHPLAHGERPASAYRVAP